MSALVDSSKRTSQEEFWRVKPRMPIPPERPDRNLRCPCGSGKKYKQCCAQAKSVNSEASPIPELMRQASALYQEGHLPEAGKIYEQVLGRNPELAEALCRLGVIAHREGRYDLALEFLTRAIAKDPSQSVFHLDLGNLMESCGQSDQAMASFRKSIELDPGCMLAHANLGNALLKKKFFPEAASSLVRALELSPENRNIVNSLGVALEKMGRLEQAIVCYRKALSLSPNYVEALTNLGNSQLKLGLKEDAIASYKHAVELNPRSYAAHCYLGVALNAVGQREAALQSCETARELQPDAVDVNLNLGNLYIEQGMLTKAVGCYRRVVEQDPLNAGAHTNLGGAYMAMGRMEEARCSFEKALEISPGYTVAFSNLLFFHASVRDIPPEAECALAKKWETCALSEEERQAARMRASRTGGAFVPRPRTGRSLRIGVVSAEFGTHAVAEFLEPLLEHLDKQRFHLTFFPTVAWSGPRTQRMVALGNGLVSLVGVPHAQAASRIRAEEIDVLMDTTGHTENCHLGIFAHRAAPVQLTYVGYWSTTGLTEMDWVFADPDMPSLCELHFTEGLWRLPRLATCYRGDFTLPESRWEPGETIWLGSFNKYLKIREQSLALWARVLKALPEAKLLLEDRGSSEAETHQRILTTLASHGVAGDRVEFVPAIPNHEQHMVLYDRLDVALDTIPFNSGTTAFDALWMGVPLVALEGSWSGGRIASSALRALGREEWIAQDEEQYVSIVRSLVEDVQGRVESRKTQRARMAASPLCDAKGLARAFEEAFEAMYDLWLDG